MVNWITFVLAKIMPGVGSRLQGSYGKCHVLRHKNTSKRKDQMGMETLKRDGFRRIFMTSHMTLSVSSL